MAQDKTDADKAAADALEQGYMGEVPDEIENEAYTVQGQGPETAKREREQVRKLRNSAYDRSGESESESEGESESSSPPPTSSKRSRDTSAETSS